MHPVSEAARIHPDDGQAGGLGFDHRARGDLERASEIRFSELPSAEREREELEQALKRTQDGQSFLNEEVSDEDIAAKLQGLGYID